MGGLKTLLFGALLGLAAPASVLSSDTWSNRFASCTGRLSAQMEHQWLMVDPRADRTQNSRRQMIDLLQAVTTEANAVHLMSIRITTKQAHSALLRRATFNSDRQDADRAAKQAAQSLAACVGLMTGNGTQPAQDAQHVSPPRRPMSPEIEPTKTAKH